MTLDSNSKSDKVHQAERMVDELLQTTSAMQVAKGSGVNYITISKIAKGDSSRISERVFESIKTFYEGRKAGTVDVEPRMRKPRTPKPAPEQASGNAASFDEGGLVSIGTIQAEILKTEKRLAILKQMLELAREL